MYPSHSTQEWSKEKQREFDAQRRARKTSSSTVPPPPRKRRGFHPLVILAPAGTIILCVLLYFAGTFLAPSKSAITAIDTQAPTFAPETPQNAAQAHRDTTTEPTATVTPTPTPTPTIGYQSTVDALKAEQAHLEATQQEINEQIQNNQDLELQVTAQYLDGLVEVEKQRVKNEIAAMQAKSEADTNNLIAESIVNIANANATATVIAEQTQIQISEINRKAAHDQEVNQTISIVLQAIIGFSGLIIIVILGLAFGRSWNIGKKHHQQKMRGIQREQTAAMMTSSRKKEPKNKNKIQVDLARLLSNSIAYWNKEGKNGREQTQIPSYDKVGFSGKNWTQLTNYLVNLHWVEKKQGAYGGTFFKSGTLHDWLMICLNGNIESTDPFKTIQPPPLPDSTHEKTKLSA